MTTHSHNSSDNNSNKYPYIQEIVDNHAIVLFMKGTPQQPLCGFSKQVVMALSKYPVTYHSENVLAHQSLRADLKEFSEWPTFPQLYVNGTFVGGCDIVCELDGKQQLEAILTA